MTAISVYKSLNAVARLFGVVHRSRHRGIRMVSKGALLTLAYAAPGPLQPISGDLESVNATLWLRFCIVIYGFDSSMHVGV
jgi:hypothetical protein